MAAIGVAAALAAASPAAAESAYTKLDPDSCQVLRTYEEGGGADLRCPGYDGLAVFVSEGDARTDVDFGVSNDTFETFSAFNGVGDTVEWLLEGKRAYAATVRFKIDVDGRSAEALVVSKVGTAAAPGCVVGIVDAAAEQANGVARGLGAMAALFNCSRDHIVIVPGARPLVREFSGANQ